MRRALSCMLAAACLVAAGPAPAAPATFDGTWTGTLTCPPHDTEADDARGYTHRFQVAVADGELSGTHGAAGEPGYHLLHGRIDADGTAALRLDGIVNNPRFAINKAQRGKPYSYRVKAHFDATSGEGRRQTGRVCTFRFAR